MGRPGLWRPCLDDDIPPAHGSMSKCGGNRGSGGGDGGGSGGSSGGSGGGGDGGTVEYNNVAV